MRHYVGYHNADEMGDELGWLPGQKEFSFWSRRPLSNLRQAEGNRVWAIDGIAEGRKKIFRLWGYYIVDEIKDLGDGLFYVIGKEGFVFEDPIELNDFKWFPEFKKKKGNFGFGVDEIRDAAAVGFLKEIEAHEEKKTRAAEKMRGKKAKGSEAFNPKYVFPEELTSEDMIEGAIDAVIVNAYERNARARKRCIEHYGLDCAVCGFNFRQVYGDAGDGIIHVHHLKPLSELQEKHKVDPIKEMRPICPNCHAFVHSSQPMLTIEKVKQILKEKN